SAPLGDPKTCPWSQSFREFWKDAGSSWTSRQKNELERLAFSSDARTLPAGDPPRVPLALRRRPGRHRADELAGTGESAERRRTGSRGTQRAARTAPSSSAPRQTRHPIVHG